MLSLSKGKHIHLIGICGTSMAPLAGMLKEREFRVTGSDAHVYPPMSDFLARLAIPVSQGYSEANLDPPPDLVVVGNALSRGNEEIEVVLDRRLRYASMPEVLKELFIRSKESIVVAGTHGKTTTASLLAWLLHQGGLESSFLVGGIAGNFASSFGLGSGRFFVVEGDEYDTAYFDKGPKFLHYLPSHLILNAIEYDHADIYPDLPAVLTTFRRLVNLVPRSGRIVAAGDNGNVRDCVSRAFCPVEFFGLEEGCSWRATRLRTSAAGIDYTLIHDGGEFGEFFLPMNGEFNVANAVAATVLAHHCGLSVESLQEGLRTFRGVRRRMEVRGVMGGVTVIDDFAHHPTAIRQTLAAVRARYPQGRLWAVVEPRSNTLRRNVFQDELKAAFSAADRILFGPVYRAEVLSANERLDLEAVREALRRQGKQARLLPGAREIVAYAAGRLQPGDVVVVMSNGGFDGIHGMFLAALGNRRPQPAPAGR